MKFKLFDTEIYFSFLFLAVITVMLATDKTGYMLPTLFAISVHEAGHLFMMWLLECAPKKIKLIPASVQISMSMSKRYRNDVLVALSGPLVNLVIFFTLYFNYFAYKNETVLVFALLNLVIAIFNLLPVKGLDGGTVLFCFLCKNLDINKATLVMRLITLILASSVIVLAVILTLKQKVNISLYIMGIYLFIITLVKM